MNETINKNDLTEGVVWKKLLVFFLPIAAGTCIQQLYNAVDGLVVGRYVGTVALAAVGGSTSQIINLLIGFFVSLTTGASVVIAQIYGAGHRDDVSRATGSAITCCALMGIVLMVFGLIASPWMLRVLKTPEDTIPGALLYLRVYFVGEPFILVLNMESNMLRAVGDSYSPFIYMIAGCVSNIILDLVFVIGFHWGIFGVAFATVIAQLVNMGLLTRNLLKTDKEYRLDISKFRLNRAYLISMVHFGVPSGLQSSMYAISNMVIQVGVNTLGTVVVASWAMTSKIDGIFWSVSNAIGAAVTTFVGQNTGAGRHDRVKTCVKQGFIIAMIFTVLLSAAIMLTAKPLLRILTTDLAVVDTTFDILTFFVPYYFAWTIIEMISAVLHGSGDTVVPVIIIGIGICLFRIIWVTVVFRLLGTLNILCLSYVISWIITDVALIIHYRKGSWRRMAESRIPA